MKILLSPSICLAAALALAAAGARADHVTFANGRTMEGRAEARGETVHIALRRGSADFPKSAVERIDAAPTPWETYAEKSATLSPKDAAGHLALAAWCRSIELPEEALREYGLTLAADPESVEARRALGYSKVNGAWMSGEEIRRAEAETREKAARIARESEEKERKEKGGKDDKKQGQGKKETPKEAGRPVEGLFGPLDPWEGEPETRPTPPRPAPVYYGYPYSYSLGALYGCYGPRLLYGAASPPTCSRPCQGLGLGLHYQETFAGGRGRISLTFGE